MAKVSERSVHRVWVDVILAVFVRHVKTQSSDRLGFAWVVLSPVIFIFGLAVIRGRIGGELVYGLPTFIFLVYGLVLVQGFLSLVSQSATAVTASKPLFVFRQVQPISPVVAVALYELLVRSAVFLILIYIGYLLGFDIAIDSPLLLMYSCLIVLLLGLSVGLLFGLLEAVVPEVKKIRSLLMRPVFFISGIFFSIKDIPYHYWPYFTWNPLLHAVEVARSAASDAYGREGVDFYFMTYTCFGLMCAAVVVYRYSWKELVAR